MSLKILSDHTWTGYLACARCSASGVCLNINPISESSASDRPLRVPTTERCQNCSGAGKVWNLLYKVACSWDMIWHVEVYGTAIYHTNLQVLLIIYLGMCYTCFKSLHKSILSCFPMVLVILSLKEKKELSDLQWFVILPK